LENLRESPHAHGCMIPRMPEETDIGSAGSTFQETLWTVVLRAKDSDDAGRRDALGRLIGEYWKPAYFFIRRRGHDVEAAKDLAQGFFAEFVEKDFLKAVTPAKGKFRSFLMASLTYFLSDQYDRSRAQKRGGGYNFVQAEEDLTSVEGNPEEAFFRRWAFEIMAQAMSRLKKDVAPEEFALLDGEGGQDLSSSDRKNRLHRLRLRLREHIRDIIRPSVATEADVDAEIAELFAVTAQKS
jgi:DNA-directed RNA polymerase specialized sigma24 family protein